MTDLSEMRRIAEAATPGPWTTNGTAIAAVGVTLCEGEEGDWDEADAIHIATFDPPTVLALLDVVGRGKELRDGIGWELDDPRMKYLVGQVGRRDLEEYDAALSRLEQSE